MAMVTDYFLMVPSEASWTSSTPGIVRKFASTKIIFWIGCSFLWGIFEFLLRFENFLCLHFDCGALNTTFTSIMFLLHLKLGLAIRE